MVMAGSGLQVVVVMGFVPVVGVVVMGFVAGCGCFCDGFCGVFFPVVVMVVAGSGLQVYGSGWWGNGGGGGSGCCCWFEFCSGCLSLFLSELLKI